MLCLGKKIRRNISWICGFICDNQNFRRSRYRVNADISVNCFFCKGNIDITRSYNLVRLWNTLCPVGKGSDGLSPADFIDRVHSCFFCGNQRMRTDFSVPSRRRHHDDLVHSGNPCRDHIHQYGRRIDRLPARHVNAHTFQWGNFLSEKRAVRLAVKPAVLLLLFVVASDIFQRFSDYTDQLFVCFFICLCNLLFGYPDRFFCKMSVVKLFGIGKERLITFLFYLFQNRGNPLFVFSITVRTSL